MGESIVTETEFQPQPLEEAVKLTYWNVAQPPIRQSHHCQDLVLENFLRFLEAGLRPRMLIGNPRLFLTFNIHQNLIYFLFSKLF